MMAANLGQAAAVASVPAAAAAGVLNVPVLLGAAGVAGLFTVWFQAGYNPYLRALVAGDDYLRANARTGGARSAATLAGPSLAGALVEAVGSATTIFTDVASFLVSFVSLALLAKGRQLVASEAGGSLLAQVKEGLTHLWASPLLRTLAWASATLNLFLTAIGAIEIVFLVRQVHASSAWVGGLIALGGIGGVAASLLAGPLTRRFGLEALARTAVAVTAPAALLIPLTSRGLGMVFFAFAGPPTSLGIALAGISFLTLRLQHCPPELQARVSTTTRAFTAAAIPMGALIGGVLGQLLGNRLALGLLAAGYLAIAVVVFTNTSLRDPATPLSAPRKSPIDQPPTSARLRPWRVALSSREACSALRAPPPGL
jgi:predicted MFS family arabinose efflux permease